MELAELYDQIQNPIDDRSVMERLINAYANMSNGGGYYSNLVKTVKKDVKGRYNIESSDKLYAMLFNKWKNSIVSITKAEYERLYRQGSYGADFVKMRNFLKKVPDVSTKKEAWDVIFSRKGDKELEDALEKYDWRSLGAGSGWEHVCSRYLTAKKDAFPNVEHRLYLDTECTDTHRMAIYFIEKCDKYHLPYYFKFDDYGDRDDTFVIYSSTESLTKFIDILREIKKEHPEIVSRSKEPPALTGVIDGWIGYGSEPSKTPDGHNQSFNEIRAKHLEETISKVTNDWIMNHRSQKVNFHGKQVSFQDYIVHKSVDWILADLEDNYLWHEKMEKNSIKRNGGVYDSAVINNKLGYSLQELRSSQFRNRLYATISGQISDLLSKVCNGTYKVQDEITMNLRNGKKVEFGGGSLKKIIKQISTQISKNDPNYISTIQREIKNSAKKYGIDSEKYCFDIKVRDKIKSMSRQNGGQKKQNTTPKKSDKEIYLESVLSTLPPNVRNIVLPNYNCTLETYLRDVAIKSMDDNFFIHTSSGKIQLTDYIKLVVDYCRKIESKKISNQSTPNKEVNPTPNKEVNPTPNKKNVSQGLLHSDELRRMVYTPMSDDEIEKTRKQLGF